MYNDLWPFILKPGVTDDSSTASLSVHEKYSIWNVIIKIAHLNFSLELMISVLHKTK